MIENFLRWPAGPAAVGADALRCLAALGVLFAAICCEPTDAAILAFALPGCVAPRFLGMRPIADAAFVAILQVAAWSNVADLYTRIAWWDLAVHFLGNGSIAVVLYLALTHAKVLPDPRSPDFSPRLGVTVVTALGLSAGAVWEMIEWLGRELASNEIYTGYEDTLSDMALGGLGSLAGGLVLARIPLLQVQAARP